MISTYYVYQEYPKVQRDAMIAYHIATWERATELCRQLEEYDRLTKETTGS